MEHSGGIHGFVTYALRMPKERVFVAVLSNNPGGAPAELLALKIAALLIGQPYLEPTPVALGAEDLARFLGAYRSAAGAEWAITCEGNTLFAHEAGQPPIALVPIAAAEFHMQDMPLYRLVFTEADDGVTGLEWHGRSGRPEAAKRIDAPARPPS